MASDGRRVTTPLGIIHGYYRKEVVKFRKKIFFSSFGIAFRLA
jgi:hypothetical protein